MAGDRKYLRLAAILSQGDKRNTALMQRDREISEPSRLAAAKTKLEQGLTAKNTHLFR
jgi:hypothetical protein